MFKMTKYDEAKADSLDKLIRAALLAASKKLQFSSEQSLALLNKIKRENCKYKNLPQGEVKHERQ